MNRGVILTSGHFRDYRNAVVEKKSEDFIGRYNYTSNTFTSYLQTDVSRILAIIMMIDIFRTSEKYYTYVSPSKSANVNVTPLRKTLKP